MADKELEERVAKLERLVSNLYKKLQVKADRPQRGGITID